MVGLLQKILKPFFLWLADKFSSAPKQADVFKSLSKLYKKIQIKDSSRGITIPVNATDHRIIIFSDQHKGTKDTSDDFANNEPNYITALKYYHQQQYTYINIGDCEELWKFTADKVIPANKAALEAEAQFQQNDRYYRTFGNHDLLWKNSLDVTLNLKSIFKKPLPVYEGMILKTKVNDKLIHIFLTHGHQGDTMSDNNALSTWIVAHIWAPIQRFLQININTPATDLHLRDKHNILMYEWSSRKKNMLLITGHTHKPVFASGKYATQDEHKIETTDTPVNVKPSYFNTGCCCYNDGDITGIEIDGGYIRLIKWHITNGTSERSVLEEKLLTDIITEL